MSALFLILSVVALVVPFLVYPLVVGWWFGLAVALLFLGYYLFVLLQVGYYACGVGRLYLAAAVPIFLTSLALTHPPLYALGPAVALASILLPLHMGVKAGVFEDWTDALAWVLAWNFLAGALAAVPIHLLGLGGGGGPWLWFLQPPKQPTEVLAIGVASSIATYILNRFWIKAKCPKRPSQVHSIAAPRGSQREANTRGMATRQSRQWACAPP